MRPPVQAKTATVNEKTVAKKADILFQLYARATMQATQLQRKVAWAKGSHPHLPRSEAPTCQHRNSAMPGQLGIAS